MTVFDNVLKACTDNGLMVIINNHVSTAGKCCSTSDGNGMWYNNAYPAEKFFTAVKDMTLRYRANSMVIGNDLRNELRPDETHGLMPTWGSGVEANDWRMAAERAGNEVLKYNSRSLVFVQGISFANNLKNVKDKPLTLSVPNKLVYSAHVYDTQAASFHYDNYASTAASFDRMFGYIAKESEYNTTYSAPIFIGEFTANRMSYNYWKFLIDYIKERKLSWAYWTFNDSLPLTGSKKTCDASAAPTNGGVGDCTNQLVHGGSCQPTCLNGYVASGRTSCNDGTTTPATCVQPKTCTPTAPTNGSIGNCPTTMAAGTSCTPGCN